MTSIVPITVELGPSQIGQIAQRRLRESPYYFLKNLSCDFEAGTLTLRGRVPYGALREFAESIVARVAGVRRVINCVEVFDPMRQPLASPAVRSAG